MKQRRSWKQGLTLTPKKGLGDSEWQALRRGFSRRGLTGGSDAGSLLGIDDYRSPSHVFFDCLGLSYEPRRVNEIMLHGTLLESYVADLWRYHDGNGVVENHQAGRQVNKYRRCNYIIENPKYPTLFANLDFEIIQHHARGTQPGVLEIKTISAEVSDKYVLGFPPKYLAQVQLYMMVTGMEWAELCWFNVGRREVHKKEISRDWVMQQQILEASHDLKQRVHDASEAIEKAFEGRPYNIDEARELALRFEPSAVGGEAYADFLSARHRAKSYDKAVQSNSFTDEAYRDLLAQRGAISDAEEKKIYAENIIKRYMMDNDANVILFDGGDKISWNKQFRISHGSDH